MGVLSLLKALCLLTGYVNIGIAGLTLPLNQAIDNTDSLTTVSLNLSMPRGVELCTSSLIWAGGTGYDSEFTNDCFLAWKSFLRTDFVMYKNVQFEFLQQGVTPSHPGSVTMATPRRYVSSE